MKTIYLNVSFAAIYNVIINSIINTITQLLRPIVQFIYTKYYNFKCYNVHKQNRIKREWKRRISICSFSLILGIIFAFTAGFFSKDIKAEDRETLHKYYTSYSIEHGDSLWMIADNYYELGYENHSEYINEVVEINHLENANDIISGESIIIPYYSYEIK